MGIQVPAGWSTLIGSGPQCVPERAALSPVGPRPRGLMPVDEHGIDHGERLRTAQYMAGCWTLPRTLYLNLSRATSCWGPEPEQIAMAMGTRLASCRTARSACCVAGGAPQEKTALHTMAAWTADHVFQISCLPTLPGAPFPTPSCIQQCRYINLHLLPTFSPRSRHRPCLSLVIVAAIQRLNLRPLSSSSPSLLVQTPSSCGSSALPTTLTLTTRYASRFTGRSPAYTLFPEYSAPLDTHTTFYSTSTPSDPFS